MVYAAWAATMMQPDKDAGEGATVRDGYLVASENPRHHSHPLAQRMLEGPALPESIEYIWNWLVDIRRGLGGGMDGLSGMTWLALDAWARLRGVALEPFEEDALFAADAMMRHPESIGKAAWT